MKLLNKIARYIKRVKGDFMNEDVRKSLFIGLLGYGGSDIIAVKSPLNKIK